MPPKKKAVPQESAVQDSPAAADPPVSQPAPAPTPPEAPAPSQPKSKGMIRSKALAALISFFLPGVGLILGNSSRTLEGAIVFILVAILDTVIVLVSVVGGPIAGILTQGACCLLTPILLLGLFLIPILHIIAAIHTWMRC